MQLNKIFLLILTLLFNEQIFSQYNFNNDEIEAQIDSILTLMTLDEKIGQLNQLRGENLQENNQSEAKYNIIEETVKGRVGSFLNVSSLEDKVILQKAAVQKSRMKIPLIFAMDVVHGFETTFPIPLGEAASWDLELIESSARISAIEASSLGYMWTFAPMVDVSRDPRWGRVMEGAGEDAFLGSRIAEARVKGFQGKDLSLNNTILACVKHFAGYGQVLAGREYNETTISKRYLYEYVLPPFKAALKIGAGSFMNSFNDFDGVPASASKYLVTDVLKNEWRFNGLVISDWDSFGELVQWGVAKDDKEAAKLAMLAGSDIDMMSLCYINYLKDLVLEGEIEEESIDRSVRRVLRLKYMLGLFDDPFRYFNRNDNTILRSEEHLSITRDAARKSMVLLKNENNILPLNKSKYKNIAVIGPIDSDKKNLMGAWSGWGKRENIISITEGIRNKLGDSINVHYAEACNQWEYTSDSLFDSAITLAKKSDLIILTLGEVWWMTGESASRAELNLGGRQTELAKALLDLGKPIICVMVTGRPRIFHWIKDNIPAILQAWIPGSEAGNAVADILFGDYNPSAKLPITFPYHTGQIPISYLGKSTGRPYTGQRFGASQYQDIPNDPMYEFGFGLSYTEFHYSDLTLSNKTIGSNDTLYVKCKVANIGNYDGEEIVQLYIRDVVASVTRPLKELKGFKKVFISKGKSSTVEFIISPEELKLWNADMKFIVEPGEFILMIGSSSEDIKLKNKFFVKNN